MSLQNVTLDAGNVTVTVATQDLVPFKADGQVVANGIHLVATSDTDASTRRQIVAKVRPASIDPKTNVWTKDKRTCTIVVPYWDGTRITYNTLRIERELVPTAPAEIPAQLMNLAVQAITSEDLEDFWTFGTFF